MPGNCIFARRCGEQPKARHAARNEGEPHLMSLENSRTMQPNLFGKGEGCQDGAKVTPATSGRDLSDGLSSHRHGGVSGVGMCEKELGVRGEIPASGRQRPTAGTSGEYREADLACVEVGA